MHRQLGDGPVALDCRQRHLRLERRAVLRPCPLHVLLPRYPRFLGAGLHLSHLSHFRGPAQEPCHEIVSDRPFGLTLFPAIGAVFGTPITSARSSPVMFVLFLFSGDRTPTGGRDPGNATSRCRTLDPWAGPSLQSCPTPPHSSPTGSRRRCRTGAFSNTT